jgi:phosphoenolpyruvate carboxykinase (ATP)
MVAVPQDKYTVKQAPSDKEIWWGDVNHAMEPKTFDKLYAKVVDHYNTNAKKMYVFDGYCGANLKTQKKGV